MTRRLAGWYLVAQGTGTLVWWLLLFASTSVRSLFLPTEEAWLAGRLLSLPDLLLVGLLSVLVGAVALRTGRCDVRLLWLLVGAVVYATLSAVGWLLHPVGHYLGAVFMGPSMILTLASASVLTPPVERRGE